jgi:hypothetical protein
MQKIKPYFFFLALSSLANMPLGASATYPAEEMEVDSPSVPHHRPALSHSRSVRTIERYQSLLTDLSLAATSHQLTLRKIKKNRQTFETITAALDAFLESQRGGALPQTASEAADTLFQLVARLSTVHSHLPVSRPTAAHLSPVRGFFTGNLVERGCQGGFTGQVTAAGVYDEQDERVFYLEIGHQIFAARIKTREPDLHTLTTVSQQNPATWLSFELDSGFNAAHDIKDLNQLWRTFLGLKKSKQPAVFYAPSHPLPAGVEVRGHSLVPLTVRYYAFEEQPSPKPLFPCLAKSCQEGTVGMFEVRDAKGSTQGKILFDSTTKKPFAINTLFGVTLHINPAFDFRATWSHPMVLWSELTPRIQLTKDLTFNRFDEHLSEARVRFSTREAFQVLSEVYRMNLQGDWAPHTYATSLEILGSLQNSLKLDMAALDTIHHRLQDIKETGDETIQEKLADASFVVDYAGRSGTPSSAGQ